MKNIFQKNSNVLPISRSANGNQGFTLVEVLIAVVIFSIAIVGVITVAVQGGASVNDAKYRAEANYLAQEGIEIIRAMRDSYVLTNPTSPSTGWNNFITDIYSVCSGPCDADILSDLNPTTLSSSVGTGLIACVQINPTFNTCQLNLDSNGFYVNSTTTVATSPFSRFITIPPLQYGATNIDELPINVRVTWQEGISTQSVSVDESLFNWYSYH